MDKNGATQGTSRDLRALQIRSFLTQTLAGGEMSVAALEERAHAAGLLAEGQSITDSKPFKSAKARLGIRSRRIGFGPGAVWFWILPAPPALEVATTVKPSDVYDVDPLDRAPGTSFRRAYRMDPWRQHPPTKIAPGGHSPSSVAPLRGGRQAICCWPMGKACHRSRLGC